MPSSYWLRAETINSPPRKGGRASCLTECPPHLAAHLVERAVDQLAIEQPFRIDGAREIKPFWRDGRKAQFAIVTHVADKQHQLVAFCARGLQRCPHKLLANSARSKRRIDRQRAKQKRR